MFLALIVCGCIPPVAGASSGLGSLHVVQLSNPSNSGLDVVKIGYLGMSLCSSIALGLRVLPAICVAPNNTTVSCVTTISRSSSTIISKLQSALNTDALTSINSGLALQRQVFQCVPVLSGLLLVSSIFFVAITRFMEKGEKGQGSVKNLQSLSRWLALLSAALSLVSAYSITQSMAAVVTAASIMAPNFEVSRGEALLGLNWACFVLSLGYMVGLKLITSSKSGES